MSSAHVLKIFGSIDVASASGPPVPCRVGCTACCHGPFDISSADAAMVADGVEQLDDMTRLAVRERARNHLSAYAAVLPNWTAPYDVDAIGDAAFDQVCDTLTALPCPALDSAGACAIYEHRPTTCRLMGRGWQAAGGDVLENACPIQDQFPGYAELRPTPLDLEQLELAMDAHDESSTLQGFVSTTVAGAISAFRRDR